MATSIANTVTKLSLRSLPVRGNASAEHNAETAKVLFLLTSLLRLGAQNHSPHPIDPDSHTRIMMCIRVLLDPVHLRSFFIDRCRESFSLMLTEQRKREAEAGTSVGMSLTGSKKPGASSVPSTFREADDLIVIRQLRGRSAMDDFAGDDEDLSKVAELK